MSPTFLIIGLLSPVKLLSLTKSSPSSTFKSHGTSLPAFKTRVSPKTISSNLIFTSLLSLIPKHVGLVISFIFSNVCLDAS